MRVIEDKIIEAIDSRRIGIVRLSKRDCVEYVKEIDIINVYLWSTVIAVIFADKVMIRSGGWETVTTKSRLNAILRRYCDASIYQSNYVWRVVTRISKDDFMTYNNETLFEDGMTIPRI